MTEKPPYRVPTMVEVRAVEKTSGLVAASTFSGCGGSSLGYRMAGYDVRYAGEFVPAARESYVANASPGTHVDDRDVRVVRGAEILAACRVGEGDLDLLDGSPPCAAFSTSGKRSEGWGEVRKYSDTKQRVDDLFFEFARLVGEVRPRAFVAENVAGLVTGVAKGYFKEILRALRAAGYRVDARVLDAQWLGVPQVRRRLIFVGVREDLGLDPVHPAPLPYRYSLAEALGVTDAEISFRSGFNAGEKPYDGADPAPVVMAAGMNGVGVANSAHQVSIERFAIGREWGKLAPGEGSDRYINLTRSHPDRPSPTVTATAGSVAAAGVTHWSEPRKFTIDELRAICSFPRDFVLTGTYAQQWERLGRAVPPLMMRAVAEAVRDRVLLPWHRARAA